MYFFFIDVLGEIKVFLRILCSGLFTWVHAIF